MVPLELNVLTILTNPEFFTINPGNHPISFCQRLLFHELKRIQLGVFQSESQSHRHSRKS